jgi:hypothetical protein
LAYVDSNRSLDCDTDDDPSPRNNSQQNSPAPLDQACTASSANPSTGTGVLGSIFSFGRSTNSDNASSSTTTNKTDSTKGNDTEKHDTE